jgi:hypothetical protein
VLRILDLHVVSAESASAFAFERVHALRCIPGRAVVCSVFNIRVQTNFDRIMHSHQILARRYVNTSNLSAMFIESKRRWVAYIDRSEVPPSRLTLS